MIKMEIRMDDEKILKEMEKHYPDYRKAYYDIKRFFRNRDLNTDRVQDMFQGQS